MYCNQLPPHDVASALIRRCITPPPPPPLMKVIVRIGYKTPFLTTSSQNICETALISNVYVYYFLSITIKTVELKVILAYCYKVKSDNENLERCHFRFG